MNASIHLTFIFSRCRGADWRADWEVDWREDWRADWMADWRDDSRAEDWTAADWKADWKLMIVVEVAWRTRQRGFRWRLAYYLVLPGLVPGVAWVSYLKQYQAYPKQYQQLHPSNTRNFRRQY